MTTTTAPATTVTLRCTTTTGHELAHHTIDTTTSFAATALRAVTGDRPSGISAEQFARATFHALTGYEGHTGLRERVIVKHLRALDALALTAVTRDIPATITWE